MRSAVIFGLGIPPKMLNRFRAGSHTEWIEGVPESSRDVDAILIFGGDGTIHRHLSALVRLARPVLVVPAGSGNDFARALGLRSVEDSVRAWREFEAGTTTPQAIDLGVITPAGEASPGRPTYFCCVAGCGLDSMTAHRANQMPRWLRGHGGYVLALVPTLATMRPAPVRLTTCNGDYQGTSEVPTVLAAFANAQFYGGGMRVAPRADLADGKLDVCRIGRINPLKLALMFPSVYFGRHLAMKEVEYSQTERVRVEAQTPLEIYADGEYVCDTPAEISIARGALMVIGKR